MFQGGVFLVSQGGVFDTPLGPRTSSGASPPNVGALRAPASPTVGLAAR